MISFGDSFPSGYGVPASYAALAAAANGWPYTAHCVAGAEAPDLGAVFAEAPGSMSRYVIGCGFNDARHFGPGPNNLGSYRDAMLGWAAWLAMLPGEPVLGDALAPGWTPMTVWGGFGRYTDTSGAYAAFSLAGTALHVATVQQDANPVSFKIEIDGVLRGTFSGQPASPINSVAGISYAPRLLRFDAGIGSHAVKVTHLGGGRLYLLWGWGNGLVLAPRPRVWLQTPTLCSAAGYAATGGSKTATRAYRYALRAAAWLLADDGLNVAAVDAFSVIDPASDVQPDGAHWLDQGHRKVAFGW